MKKLTNESKARFFASHYGQSFQYDGSLHITRKFDGLNRTWGVEDEHGESFNIAKCKLIQTPLQNILDEHRNELELFEKDINTLTVFQYQFLQAHGYALDYYCPIENRIIPVQEQIDNGWITLKTQ